LRIFEFAKLKGLPENAGVAKDLPPEGTSVWYKFNVGVGDKWVAWGLSPERRTTIQKFNVQLISKSASVAYRGQRYNACYEFRFSPVGTSNGDIYEWLAADTGIIKRTVGETKTGYYLMWKKSPLLDRH
jgi:hypothetical protein